MNFLSKISFMGGFLDGIGEFFDDLLNFFPNLITAYFTYFMMMFYYLFIALASILDVIQGLFRKLAGIDEYSMAGTSEIFSASNGSGDIALSIMTNDAIMDIFVSMAILGIVILFLATIISIVKEEYKPLSEKTSPGKVIGKAIRSVFYFITVPAIAIVGVMIGSALLQSLDMATSKGNNANLSARIFESAAYTANRYRSNDGYSPDLAVPDYVSLGGELSGDADESGADKIDEAFINNTTFTVDANFDASQTNVAIFEFGLMDAVYAEGDDITLNIYNPATIILYYNIFEFNWLIAYGATIMLIGILGSTMIALVKRIYQLAVLFAISPGIVAVMPLTEDPYKNWRKSFISSALSAYSVIVVMNLYLIIMPIIGQIQFYPITSTTAPVTRVLYMSYNYIAQLLMIIAGSLFFKDFSGELAKIIGANDAYGEGASKSAEMAAATAKVAGAALTGGATLAAGTKATLGAGKKIGGAAKNSFQGRMSGQQKEDNKKYAAETAESDIRAANGWDIKAGDKRGVKAAKTRKYNRYVKSKAGQAELANRTKENNKELNKMQREDNVKNRRAAHQQKINNILTNGGMRGAIYAAGMQVPGAVKNGVQNVKNVGGQVLNGVSNVGPIKGLIGTMYGSKLGVAMSPITSRRKKAYEDRQKDANKSVDKIANAQVQIDGLNENKKLNIAVEQHNKNEIQLGVLKAKAAEDKKNGTFDMMQQDTIDDLERATNLSKQAVERIRLEFKQKVAEVLQDFQFKGADGSSVSSTEDLNKLGDSVKKNLDSLEKALKELEKKMPKK